MHRYSGMIAERAPVDLDRTDNRGRGRPGLKPFAIRFDRKWLEASLFEQILNRQPIPAARKAPWPGHDATVGVDQNAYRAPTRTVRPEPG